MTVRFLVSIAGNAEPMYDLPEFSFSPGDTANLHDDLAAAWIDAGHVEAVIVAKPSRKTSPKAA